jgi:diguanylate cyclase (GGDEF)-like protein
LKIAERTKQAVLLFFADLDHMKQINDTLGHKGGDSALVEVAAVLKETFRKSDIIGRIGGDEFAVLALDTTDETGDVLMDRLQSALKACGQVKTIKQSLSLSVGVARYDPEDACSLDELMARADALMYTKKRAVPR